mgnify:CR=1
MPAGMIRDKANSAATKQTRPRKAEKKLTDLRSLIRRAGLTEEERQLRIKHSSQNLPTTLSASAGKMTTASRKVNAGIKAAGEEAMTALSDNRNSPMMTTGGSLRESLIQTPEKTHEIKGG